MCMLRTLPLTDVFMTWYDNLDPVPIRWWGIETKKWFKIRLSMPTQGD